MSKQKEKRIHKEPRIGPLDTVGGITTEMGKVYRNMRRAELDTLDGSRLIGALAQMRMTMADGELEARLRAVESAL